jgi:phenylpyruvate tautomerase PptA (4-oxalocrotonate tautomerase family)
MPLVGIDIGKGNDADYRQAIGHAVYDALVSVGVPENDRFQVVGEHDTRNFLFDPDYLGIHRSDDPVTIQITWNEGRTVEQKKTLFKPIVDGLSAKPGIRPEDIVINLIDVKKETGRLPMASCNTRRECAGRRRVRTQPG